MRCEMNNIYDVIIIGSGPAGLSAAVYAERAKLHMLVLEENGMSGGQVALTYDVDNYLGFHSINGFDLSMKFTQHADELGVKITQDDIKEITTENDLHTVVGAKNRYKTKTVVIATGASHKKLGVDGEERLRGKGVSYCATCDGNFFRNRTVAVVGGGDTAVEDAIYLANLCKKVYLIHRRDHLRAARSLEEKLLSFANVEIIWDTIVEQIQGNDVVEALQVKNTMTKATAEIKLDGIFIAVGITPNSESFRTFVATDERGFIIGNEDCETPIAGVFVAGDIRTKNFRQIVTAVADGAVAIHSVEQYLMRYKA